MNQILYTGEVKNKKIVSKKDGMVLISILLIIIAITIISFNISSLNTTAKAMSQNEELIGQLPQENLIVENSIQENSITENIEKENIILSEKVEEEKEPVIQKVQGSDGKSYESIAVLKIPSLNIEYPVLSSTSTELLKISLNKYWGANPNEVGNMCIVGHNYNDSRFFR